MCHYLNSVLKCVFSVVLFFSVAFLGNAELRVTSKTPPVDTIILYSTSPGESAYDGGSGSRNSPFAAAFLENARKKDPLLLLAADIMSGTYKRTNDTQLPVVEAQIINNKKYSLTDRGKKKYALLIGNGNYNSIQNCVNSVNDVQDIAGALKQLGYEVEVKTDLKQSEMVAAADAFKAKLRAEKDSEGFFWYAGHGGKIDGADCLLPVDCDTTSAARAQATSFLLSSFLAEMRLLGNKINVFFIDTDRGV